MEHNYSKGFVGTWIVILVIAAIIYTVVYSFVIAKKNVSPASPQRNLRSVSPTTSQSGVPLTNNIYMVKTDSEKGIYLTDFQGMTLYIFDNDNPGISNCEGNCATLWPTYSSGATAQSQFPVNITVITRTDGSKQFAWKGKPLYYYSNDQKPGDILGDGKGGVWHLVKP
jgi:predicted lipoprotein with Yx(FWY)xxD motif